MRGISRAPALLQALELGDQDREAQVPLPVGESGDRGQKLHSRRHFQEELQHIVNQERGVSS